MSKPRRQPRGAAETSLKELLKFERLLADLSVRFANVSADRVELEIEFALKQLLQFLDFDRGSFGEFAADGTVTVICSVAREGVEPYPLGSGAAFANWYLGQLRAEKTVRVRSIDDLPPQASGEIEYFRQSGMRSTLGIPLRVGGQVVSFLAFSAFRYPRDWPDDLIARLKIVGEAIAQAFARKRSEAALQASEERWRSMFQASNLGISIMDQNLRYIATNPAFQAMLGYTDHELQNLTLVDLTAEEDGDVTRIRLHELRQGMRRHYETVKQYRRKDGTMMWGRVYASAVRDAQSRAKMFIGTLIDVTATKHAQDALRATQAKLAHITRRTTMQEVTATIAHEVNQPLAAIVANGNAALRWLRKTPPDVAEAMANVNQIISDGHRAGGVIASIRGMFKKDEHARVLLDVNTVIREVLELLQGELSSKRISVRTKLSRGLPRILADQVQLQQVVFNLITNAVESMSGNPVGSRKLNVISKPSQSDEVIVAVEDSGPGIDPKNLDRIFNAFFTTKSQGMGMGLAISRSIVETHGGRLWASGRRPHGSIFYLALPSAAADDARAV